MTGPRPKMTSWLQHRRKLSGLFWPRAPAANTNKRLDDTKKKAASSSPNSYLLSFFVLSFNFFIKISSFFSCVASYLTVQCLPCAAPWVVRHAGRHRQSSHSSNSSGVPTPTASFISRRYILLIGKWWPNMQMTPSQNEEPLSDNTSAPYSKYWLKVEHRQLLFFSQKKKTNVQRM